MSDRTTINVSKDAHREASKAKHDNESWTEYLLRCTEEAPSDVDEFAIAEAIIDELEDEHKKTQELAEQARDNTEEIKNRVGR